MIDMVPLTLITTSLLLEYFIQLPQLERAINSVSSFFLWLKFLYFLRMNRPSSKFISMIVSVMGRLQVFLAVFIIGLVSFSQSFYIISNNNADPDLRFIDSFGNSLLYTYELSLGNWDSSNFTSSRDAMLGVFLFLLSTMFLMIIMLNLLIAVISDVYAEVEERSENELYKNLSDLIVENEYQIKGKDIRKHDDQGDYLYIAKSDQTIFDDDSVEMKLTKLRRTVNKRTYYLNYDQTKFIKELNKAVHTSTEKYLTLLKEQSSVEDQKFKNEMKKFDIMDMPSVIRQGTSY
mmetsp:Transcript_35538/g.34561  ORF Transcript_35538/g.34561 Transcript_35538/m.34561 type:complete len:291 (+) Transcript_35538:1040-1912(+)|eukprot:CAMPEP_0170545754 /NCGR_PEP_ID=MMETSP0211-20121228/4117_1 /TAXON_ID=311385 /ORGANISM="Pseudokeronopsis sp., Strain OXSARD2" /LENGTH=290 /DNA_ID=CAMNT_0010849827 /DNA_START=1719 /DNA_END=2591 /DNA_ORIENTATION=-